MQARCFFSKPIKFIVPFGTDQRHPSTCPSPPNYQAGLPALCANQPETQQFYANLGATAMSGGPEQMRNFQADEIALWKRIAMQAKIELQ